MSDLDLCLPVVVPIAILFIVMASEIKKQQLVDAKSGAVAKTNFALEKNKASLAIIGCFVALFAYAFFDYFFANNKMLINSNGDFWYAPVLAISVFPAYKFLKKNNVPHLESLSLSIFLTVSVFSAFVPAIQRLDQMLSDGMHPYEYILRSDASFEPKTPGAPPIKVLQPKAYWAQFKEGSIHTFDIVHGPLNVWQMDTTKHDKELKLFFDKRKQNK